MPSYSDSLNWVPDEGTYIRTGIMEVFLSPPRTSAVLITTSVAIIYAPTEEIVEEEEDVEFRNGEGSVSKPIYDIVKIVWYNENLGAISFDQYSTSLSTSLEDNENSVARVTYNIKVRKYQIKYPNPIPVGEDVPAQFLIEDSEL